MSLPVVVSRIQNRRGTQDQFNALYPIGYGGVGGFGSGSYSPPYTLTNYPNVLMPGELALCTDTRNIFLGNLNGEYIEIGQAQSAAGLSLQPTVITLPPVGSFTPIPQLSYIATPFFNILYSIADSGSLNWNTLGTNFGRNGELQITAIGGNATLVDVCSEINNFSQTPTPQQISFEAQFVGSNIQVFYISTLPISVTFSTSTINWLPF